MPEGRFMIRSRHCWLSGKSDMLKSIPSSWYTASSCLKVTSLNIFWRRSFERLIKSCSRPFGDKFSKPKMSRTPKNVASGRESRSKARFTRATTSLNKASKMCFASASRAAAAALTSCEAVTLFMFPGRWRTLTTRSCASSCGFTPSSAEAVVSTAMSFTLDASTSPSGRKVTLPRCSTPLSTLNTSNWAWSCRSRKRIESRVALNSRLSSRPGTSTALPEPPRRYTKFSGPLRESWVRHVSGAPANNW
mmetsp:Transcript_3491/g.8133  ORF Transcript_3491/g.8133 Transcript_3491/m.8133 type:complete len:249 (+) Transcript_3491:4086-4832(+)